VVRTEGQPESEGSRAGHRSVVLIRARSQRYQHLVTEQDDDDEYIYDDVPIGMEAQEGNDQMEEPIGPEPRRVPLAQPSNTLYRANTWPSSNCSDDWIWNDDSEEKWEQCPIDIPEHVGVEMASSQGYMFANDSGREDEDEAHPSPCISVTSNLTRKRTLSEDTHQYATVETQTTPRNSAAGYDHRDQMTQWSTPDIYQPRATEDNTKKDTGGTPIATPLLCNSCWCHWCQRPSEHCGPFSCTSPYIWYLGISREELDAKELPEYITKILVAMGVLDPPNI
jgi:hypothetical protein